MALSEFHDIPAVHAAGRSPSLELQIPQVQAPRKDYPIDVVATQAALICSSRSMQEQSFGLQHDSEFGKYISDKSAGFHMLASFHFKLKMRLIYD